MVRAEVEAGRRQQLAGAVLVDQVPLEVEEEQLRLDRGRELARLLHQPPRGIGGVEREAEHRVGPGAAGEVVDGAEPRIASASSSASSSATRPL